MWQRSVSIDLHSVFNDVTEYIRWWTEDGIDWNQLMFLLTITYKRLIVKDVLFEVNWP